MGLLNLTSPDKMVTSIIMLVVGLSILVGLLPTGITAIINLSTIGNLEFASFYASGGVVLLVLGAAVLLGVLGVIGLKKSMR